MIFITDTIASSTSLLGNRRNEHRVEDTTCWACVRSGP
jgi:hypothetical protein